MKKMIAAMVVATLGMSSAALAQTTPPAGGGMPGLLGGTGLTVGATAGILAGVLVLGVALSEDDNNSTTTTPPSK